MLGQKPAQRRVVDEELEDESEGRNFVDGHGDVHQVRAEQAVTKATTSSEDEDDALSYFQKLAES